MDDLVGSLREKCSLDSRRVRDKFSRESPVVVQGTGTASYDVVDKIWHCLRRGQEGALSRSGETIGHHRP